MPDIFYRTREIVLVKARVTDDVKQHQAEMVADGRCLGCEEVLRKGERVRRGLCPSCYQAARRTIKARRVSEGQLIREGKMLEAKEGGRPTENKFVKELAER